MVAVNQGRGGQLRPVELQCTLPYIPEIKLSEKRHNSASSISLKVLEYKNVECKREELCVVAHVNLKFMHHWTVIIQQRL